MDKKIKSIVFNSGHIDIEWYKTLDSYRLWFAEVIDILYEKCLENDDYESYVLDGVVFWIDDLLEYFPTYREKVNKLIEKGKLIIGPFYTQFDEWIPSAECMVKNCLWGNRKSIEYGGKPMQVGYFPDNFGHPYQLPQILQNFGIDNLLFTRGMVDIPKGREFWHEGADGSKILAVNNNYSSSFIYTNNNPKEGNPNFLSYYNRLNGSFDSLKLLSEHRDKKWLATKMIESVKGCSSIYGNVIPFAMCCDHCPPQVELGKTVKLANEMQDEIEFVFKNPEYYFNSLDKKGIEYNYKGELIGCLTEYILFGVLTSRIYQKIDIFATEAMLFRYALPLVAICEKYGYYDGKYDTLLEKCTKNVLINSTHDSCHGSSIDEVHKEMESRNIFVKQTCSDVVIDLLKQVGSNLKYEENKIVIYNPNKQVGKQICTVWLPVGDKKFVVKDSSGNILPSQAEPRDRTEVNNKNGKPYYTYNPSMEYRKVDICVSVPQSGITALQYVKEESEREQVAISNEIYIENEFYRIAKESSYINILDKTTGMIYEKLNVIKDVEDVGDAWDYSESFEKYSPIYSTDGEITSVRSEKGGLYERLEIKGNYSLPKCMKGDIRESEVVLSEYVYEITLWKGIPRVDVKLVYDNKACDHMASVIIPLPISAKTVFSQGAFCTIDRTVEPYEPKQPWMDKPTDFLPFNEWLSVEDEKNGFAIAAKGLCAYQVQRDGEKVVLSIPINRSYGVINKINTKRRVPAPGGDWAVWDAQCIRKTEIEFSYIPYKAEKGNRTPFINEVESFLYPIASVCPYEERTNENANTVIKPFEIIDGECRVSIIDRSYDKKYYVLRLYENRGVSEKVKLKIDGKEVYFADMNEQIKGEVKQKDGVYEIALTPYKIITILWR